MTHILLLSLAMAAPAPLAPAKPPAQPSPVGEWMLEWNGGEGPCRLDRGGSFACVWCGTLWIGTWELRDGVLTVDEHIPARHEREASGQRIKWSAGLEPGTLRGTLGGGGLFGLRKIEGKVKP